jgi:hypothetical protein
VVVTLWQIWFLFVGNLNKKIQHLLQYNSVCKQLKIAQREQKEKYENLVQYFERDRDATLCDACIKKQTFLGLPPRKLIGNQDRWKDCYVIVSRCVYFRPIGNEKLCPRTECKYFVKNKEYVNALNKLKELEEQKKKIWINKTK